MKKSQEEIECEELEDKYREKFGKPYPWYYDDDRPMSYHMKAIRKSLETGVPAKGITLPKGAM